MGVEPAGAICDDCGSPRAAGGTRCGGIAAAVLLVCLTARDTVRERGLAHD